ncbi:hypothetical protein BY996DRAFT_6414586 [Phakopsora pachyrhizi]|nr:hypothetical protein BY996DRAFT_6414586 [Phakopsora pachyrhizi]
MCKQAGKIAKTQIVFKIGGLTEENFAYAQQETQVVLVSSAHYGVVKLALPLLIFGSGLGLGLAVVELVDDSFRYQQFRLFDADVCRVSFTMLSISIEGLLKAIAAIIVACLQFFLRKSQDFSKVSNFVLNLL